MSLRTAPAVSLRVPSASGASAPRRLALAAAVLCALGAQAVQAAELRTRDNPIEGRYIVVFKDEALGGLDELRTVGVEELARSLTRAHGATLLTTYQHALQGFAVDADDAALAQLLADPRVAYIEEDGEIALGNTTQPNPTWGLDRIDQRALPLDAAYGYSTTASNVHAYIVDSGILTSHSQFTGRIGNGFSMINDGRGVEDCNGHGTHVAGTVGGSTWGVAKGVTLHPVRVFGCSGGSAYSTVIAGLDWVRANHVKPAVVNMSLGGGASDAMDAATNSLIGAGITVVVAAGNQTADACRYSPARVPNAITVGATQSNDARSSFSNFGPCVDLFAPGSHITSAWWTSPTASTVLNGTSMAAPHAAGVAALYLATQPTASPATVRNALTNNATANVVGDPQGAPNRLLYSRFGASTPPPAPPTITSLSCVFDGRTSDCYVQYTSATPASVTWNRGSSDGSWSYDVCGLRTTAFRTMSTSDGIGARWTPKQPVGGYVVSVNALVRNDYGYVQRAVNASCNSLGTPGTGPG